MKKKIVLFGGAFDPIHIGHLSVAKRALEYLNPEKVIFIPTRHSPFKGEEIEPTQRLDMVNLALRELNDPRFISSSYEIDQTEDKSYSIKTVDHYLTIYPKEEYELYFLIGTDQLNSLPKWYKIDELASKVTFLVYLRKDYPYDEALLKAYKGIKLEGEVVDISSSDIRSAKKFMTPLSVLRYIEDNSLYYIPFIKQNEKPTRFSHSKEVAHLCYHLAEVNHLEPYRFYMAGLLHDITRMKSTPSDIRQAEKDYSSYFPNSVIPSWCYHQFTACYFLKREMGLEDEGVLEAIRFHTTGNKDMSPLGLILYASDKIEPTRGYDSSELIKAMEEDYIKGFSEVLKANREFLNLQHYSNFILDEFTKNCFNCYLKGI